MNPRLILAMWMWTLLMAGAIALGPIYIYVVAGFVFAFTLAAI